MSYTVVTKQDEDVTKQEEDDNNVMTLNMPLYF